MVFSPGFLLDASFTDTEEEQTERRLLAMTAEGYVSRTWKRWP